MPDRPLSLSFPAGGVSRRLGYRDIRRPFTSAWAWNVWNEGQVENRERGGARPGLKKANGQDFGTTIGGIFSARFLDANGAHHYDLYVVADGKFWVVRNESATDTTDSAILRDVDGNPIQTEAGENITVGVDVSTTVQDAESSPFTVASYGNKLYLADSVLKVYDPLTGIVAEVSAAKGSIPTGQTIVSVYRGRIVLSGADHVWYASRMNDPSDWDFGGEFTDPGRSVVGQAALAGQIGGVVHALIPHVDQHLVIATPSSIHVLRGDFTDGRIDEVSGEIGIIGRSAWAKSPEGAIAFLSQDGVYLWQIGSQQAPTRFSEERVPEQLREIDPDTTSVSMAYDVRNRGYHLFLTPATGDGTHWWLDVERRSMWPVRLTAEHQPLCAVQHVTEDVMPTVVLGCKDGYLREFSKDAEDDDGTPYQSHVILGPIRVSGSDDTSGLLSGIRGSFSGADVHWRVFGGEDAESVSDEAVAAMDSLIDGGTALAVRAQGVWSGGRSRDSRTRVRGPWIAILLSAPTGQWAFENVTVSARPLGKARIARGA